VAFDPNRRRRPPDAGRTPHNPVDHINAEGVGRQTRGEAGGAEPALHHPGDVVGAHPARGEPVRPAARRCGTRRRLLRVGRTARRQVLDEVPAGGRGGRGSRGTSRPCRRSGGRTDRPRRKSGGGPTWTRHRRGPRCRSGTAMAARSRRPTKREVSMSRQQGAGWPDADLRRLPFDHW